MRSPPKKEVKIGRHRWAGRKRWSIVEIIVDDLLKQQNGVTFYEVYRIATRLTGLKLRIDLIPASIMGKPYYVDCRTRTIYRA